MTDYPQVSIGSQSYTTFADQADADLYLDASINAAADAWRSDDTDDTKKARALVSATRWLDSATWLGDKTDSAQEHAFPRTGISGVANDELPLALMAANIELAALLVDDPDLRINLAAPLAKEQHAGSVGQTFFRPENVQVLTPFPEAVMKLIGQWLNAGSTAGAPLSFGTDGEPRTVPPFDFRHGV